MKAKFQMVKLKEIGVNPWQPRKRFDGQRFDDLVASVREKGVLEPILVRPIEPGVEGIDRSPTRDMLVKYQLVAGERRFRAMCKVAGELDGREIPAMVRKMTDDEAFDIMTIENLHREDLNECEEAESFQSYLDRHGMQALEGLAERVGVSSRYIRRRIRLLGLPAPVLDAWREGKLAYGYLEQLCRLEDEEEILDLLNEILGGWEFTMVKDLKYFIDNKSPALSSAKWKIKSEGCTTCAQNSEVQTSLFGGESKKALCLNPACFKEKQTDWFLKNWKKTSYHKEHGTNAFRFSEDISFSQWEQLSHLFDFKVEKCRGCKDFCTLINLDGSVYQKMVCTGDKACHRAVIGGTPEASKPGASGNGGPRVPWHGEYFREEFYKSRIPVKLAEVAPDDEKSLRVALFALVDAEARVKLWFVKKHELKEKGCDEDEEDDYDGFYPWVSPGTVWRYIEGMDRAHLLEDLREGSTVVLMEKSGPDARRLVASHIGIDLNTEWRINEEYLKKKTVKEIHELADEFGLWERREAQTFLYETLLKKRGAFKGCKKPELVRIILESGMDLAGVVPAEVLGEKGESDNVG